MTLKDTIPVGMSLPHRSPDPIDVASVRRVAERAEALGFSDLWVTENTLDHVFSFDPAVILAYAAAVTTRIRLGVAVAVLPVHNPSHVAHVLEAAKAGKVRAIVQQAYYPSGTSKLIADKTGASFVQIPGYPDYAKGQSYIAYVDGLVAQLAKALAV